MPEGQPIRYEQPISAEAQKSQYDALLVHGYWMTQKGEHTAPALRTHFTARAAALAWDNGRGAGKIVVDLGHLWGPDYPTEGKVIADTLVNKYHVPREAIVLREEGYSTYGEVGTALQLAKENGWTNILDISFGAHKKTIKVIYNGKDYKELRQGLNIQQKSVEEILQNDDPRIVEVLRQFNGLKSKYRLGYEVYEGLKWTRMHLPKFDYKALDQTNRALRTEPTEDSQLPFRFDKYKLPSKKTQ